MRPKSIPRRSAACRCKWILLDDATDPTTAVKNARKFVDEDKVDIILGSTSTITATAMSDVAVESKTPQIGLSPMQIPEAKLPWVFNLPQPVPIMVSAIIEDMKKSNMKTVAFIGFADGWGDLNWNALNQVAKKEGINIVAAERYNRTDTSVTAPALKILASSPDAVFVGASGTAAALPHVTLKDQGYNGRIYHTHGTVDESVHRCRRQGGRRCADADGTGRRCSRPCRRQSDEKGFARLHPEIRGEMGQGLSEPNCRLCVGRDAAGRCGGDRGTQEGKAGHAGIPRRAARCACNPARKSSGTNAIYRYTPTDHYGVDERARVMVMVKDGAFRLAK